MDPVDQRNQKRTKRTSKIFVLFTLLLIINSILTLDVLLKYNDIVIIELEILKSLDKPAKLPDTNLYNAPQKEIDI